MAAMPSGIRAGFAQQRFLWLLLVPLIAGCTSASPTVPIFHDPHETRVAGWTGIDARPLVPSNETDQISGIVADNGQTFDVVHNGNGLYLSDFTLAVVTVGGNLLTAQVKPGSYLLELGCDSALPHPAEPVGGLYEVEVTSGSHAVPVPVPAGSIGVFDDEGGGLGGCPASPGTAPPVSPAPTPTSS
jgi:hypothetical protein